MLLSTAVREIEDLIHNWKVSFKVINKDCLFYKQTLYRGCYHQRWNKENCVEYFHHRQQNIQRVGEVCSILYSW